MQSNTSSRIKGLVKAVSRESHQRKKKNYPNISDPILRSVGSGGLDESAASDRRQIGLVFSVPWVQDRKGRTIHHRFTEGRSSPTPIQLQSGWPGLGLCLSAYEFGTPRGVVEFYPMPLWYVLFLRKTSLWACNVPADTCSCLVAFAVDSNPDVDPTQLTASDSQVVVNR
uniref:Uncharacterized protein n=1 Tax=Cannabis sativa TaxID=3483 RepID=A0A803NIH1_CANSA